MNTNKPNYNLRNEFEESLNLRDELEKYLIHWKWFFLSSFLIVLLSFLYLRYTTPQYRLETTILVKDDENSFGSELSAFQDLGFLAGGSNNIANEIQLLKSRSLANIVIDELNLNVSYFEEGRIKESEIYEDKLPFTLKLTKQDEKYKKLDTIFYVKLISENSLELLNYERENITEVNYGDLFLIDSTEVKFEKTTYFNSYDINREIRVQFRTFEDIVSGLVKSISVEPLEKKSSVLKLIMNYPIKEKGMAILNSLVSNYNYDAIRDKNEVGKNTSKFILERLQIIKNELSKVDKDAESYKKKNKLTDIQGEVVQFSESLKESEKQLFETNIQVRLADFMVDYIDNQGMDFQLIPVNLGFTDVSISKLIQQYNEVVILRNKTLRNSSLENPVVIDADAQLTSFQKSLKESLKNLKESLNITLNELERQDVKINKRIASIPQKEREYKNIARQQQIKEALYLYLLQKQEETSISLAVTTANSKVIDRAYSSKKPVSPKKSIILLAALFLGFLIPFGIIYISDLLDTKLHTRKDLEQMVSAPLLGDIPINDSKENIVVKEGGRSSTAEAFRLLRTNLDFLLTNVEENCKSIFVTSTTSGEGKSFVSVNLACTLALSGKKVALIGMDLRAPKITEYIGIPNTKGVSNYIKDTALNILDLKIPMKGYDGLDIYSSGIIPPNPAELLLNKRVEEMFKVLKESYDYIVVDTAPVNLVTDTLMISNYADLFIYVARAGYLDKRLLAIPQDLYKDKRLPNMAMLINASDYKKSYGYGAYGAYGYGEPEPDPWWKRIFKRA